MAVRSIWPLTPMRVLALCRVVPRQITQAHVNISASRFPLRLKGQTMAHYKVQLLKTAIISMFIIPGNVISPTNVITSTSAMCIGTNVSHWHGVTQIRRPHEACIGWRRREGVLLAPARCHKEISQQGSMIQSLLG